MLAVLSTFVVVFSLVSLLGAFIQRYPAYTVGSANLAAIKGKPCSLADQVLVEPDPGRWILQPVDGSNPTEALRRHPPRRLHTRRPARHHRRQPNRNQHRRRRRNPRPAKPQHTPLRATQGRPYTGHLPGRQPSLRPPSLQLVPAPRPTRRQPTTGADHRRQPPRRHCTAGMDDGSTGRARRSRTHHHDRRHQHCRSHYHSWQQL
ncbi:MAG: arabinosyltransferase C-terminal domain-containing protein [Lawsonella clevelandensis]